MLEFIKQMLKSRTVIIAWVTFAIGVLGYVAGQDVIKQYPEVAAFIVAVVGALQFVARLLTSVPLSAKRSLFRSK